MKKEKIFAVHDRNLRSFLDKLELLQKIENGEIKCINCDRIITLENLALILPVENHIELCCDNPECFYSIREHAQKTEERQKL